MKIEDIKIEIRIALLDLGRNPYEKLPTKRAPVWAKHHTCNPQHRGP